MLFSSTTRKTGPPLHPPRSAPSTARACCCTEAWRFALKELIETSAATPADTAAMSRPSRRRDDRLSRQAMASKDYELARRLAEQAEVDAEVAELRSQSARSRQAAQESRDASRVLSEEINRKSVR